MKRIIYISFALFLLLNACTEDFDVTLESTHVRMVIQGSISDQRSAHQVTLTRSADYFSNKPAPRVSGASVTIDDGENTFTLTEVEEGIYETDTMSGVVGKTYTLTIQSGGETYTASSKLNYCAPIDSINFGFYDYKDYYIEEEVDSNGVTIEPFLSVLLNAMEPETSADYYLWKVYKNGVLESDTLSEVYFSDDFFINGFYMQNVEVQYVYNVVPGDVVTLEMQSITEEYYNYIIELLTETVWNMGPLDGPPANPVGNISNGAMGFFIAYSVVQCTEIIPEEEAWIELFWY